jgi:hypothetical protein
MQQAPNKKQGAIDEYGLDDRDAARFFGVSVYTVQRWRVQSKGPRFRRVGQRVRYSLSDLRAFWEQLPCGGGQAA